MKSRGTNPLVRPAVSSAGVVARVVMTTHQARNTPRAPHATWRLFAEVREAYRPDGIGAAVVVDFPRGHTGFSEHPAEFTEVLRRTFPSR